MSTALSTGGRVAALALLPFGVLALSGCGKTVKASDVESKITRNLQGQMPSRTITTDCPSGKKAEQGTTFTCTVKIDGQASVADVKLVSDERFSFSLHSKK